MKAKPKVQPKERPILFCRSMVRAILEGRKTQTRRTCKVQASEDCGVYLRPDGFWTYTQCKGVSVCDPFACPYGNPGDRLWVKETFFVSGRCVVYRASVSSFIDFKWKPSIFMPRKFSRLMLEIVRINLHPVQHISERDAIAEGVTWRECENFDPVKIKGPYGPVSGPGRIAYQELWDRINGKKHPWISNPWVWSIEFRLLETEYPLSLQLNN